MILGVGILRASCCAVPLAERGEGVVSLLSVFSWDGEEEEEEEGEERAGSSWVLEMVVGRAERESLHLTPSSGGWVREREEGRRRDRGWKWNCYM